ncbi:MAG: DAK2 domain-containing protein [Mycobacteriales bacterium]
MPDALDPSVIRAWYTAALAGLSAARAEIDALNVYPVHDRDTGTNLLVTLRAAAAAAEQSLTARPDDVPGMLRALADGALRGARGNSGVIASQLLLGAVEVLAGQPACGSAQLAAALGRADQLAYAAVAAPVEGTILSVLSVAAAAARASGSEGAAAVAVAAADAAREACGRTTGQLPALAAAGVVDAGGRGLCVLLDALVAALTGVAPPVTTAQPPLRLVGPREQGSADYDYEVEFLLEDAAEAAVDELRATLSDLGDSLVVIGGTPVWRVHVHVNDVGAALKAGMAAGRPTQLRVTRFAEENVPVENGGTAAGPASRAVLAVADGAGLRQLFEAGGAVVVSGQPGAGPSVAELRAEVESTGASEVVIMPNDPAGQAVAMQAAEAARARGTAVAVVPTRSVVQGLAALAVADPTRRFGDDVIAMTAAAGATRWAELVLADRDAITTAGLCRAGDVLAVVDGEVVLVGTDLEVCALELVERMLGGGGELVTVVAGSAAPPALGETLARHLHRSRPGVETLVYDGGQLQPPVLLGVE